MKKFLISALLLASSLQAFDEGSFANSLGMNEPKEIIINNRILLKIEGKPISLMDVVKKMDYLFYREYPHLASSLVAKYQFYSINWKAILDAVINDRLITLDAAEKKVEEIKDGDIRQTLEDLFGPDVVITLDGLGMTFEEAWDLVKTELIVRQMNGMMVRSRAQFEIIPKEVKKTYEKMVSKMDVENKWIYQTLTIESKDSEKGKSAAEKASALLAEQKMPLTEIASLIKEESIEVRLSEEFQRKDKELSTAHKAILQTLAIGSSSAPIVQSSKKDGAEVYRIFHLKECQEGKKVPLSEIEVKISEEMMAKALARHGETYSKKLRHHYGVTDEYLKKCIPENFTPFSLR